MPPTKAPKPGEETPPKGAQSTLPEEDSKTDYILGSLFQMLVAKRPELARRMDLQSATAEDLLALLSEAIEPEPPMDDPLAGVAFDPQRLASALAKSGLRHASHERIEQPPQGGGRATWTWARTAIPLTLEHILSTRVIDDTHVSCVTADGRKLVLEI